MSTLDRKLTKLIAPARRALDDESKDYLLRGIEEQIKQAFIDEGWADPKQVEQWQRTASTMANLVADLHSQPRKVYVSLNKQQTKAQNLMTGPEWYERFKAEYHNKADWIAADESMGDDAEHDVLLAARLASGIKE